MKFSGLVSLLLAGCLAMTCRFSDACQICIPVPQKSVADYLIESELIVLGREDPKHPFHVEIIETLKGKSGEEKVDLFLDSTTRRLLARHPEQSILIAKEQVASGESWKRIGLMDLSFATVVRDILKQAPEWSTDDTSRSAYFVKYLNDKNAQVRRLARLELARAPYAQIRKYGHVISRDDILSFLQEMKYAEWQPLYILLLAQSGLSEDADRVRSSMEMAVHHGAQLNLSAWATALVEVDRLEGIQFLERHYFSNKSRGFQELQEICLALSAHGSLGEGALRDRIVITYGIALNTHPELAPVLVKDLLKWNRFDLSNQMEKIAMSDPPLFVSHLIRELKAYGKDRQ